MANTYMSLSFPSIDEEKAKEIVKQILAVTGPVAFSVFYADAADEDGS